MKFQLTSILAFSWQFFDIDAFALTPARTTLTTKASSSSSSSSATALSMVMDDAMVNRLDGIRRSYLQLTERLADPDVIADSNLLMKVMKDRSESEEVVTNFEEVS